VTWRPSHTCDIARTLVCVTQGGEDPKDALSCRSFLTREPLIIGLFCGKWPIQMRHPMGLRHPVRLALSYVWHNLHSYVCDVNEYGTLSIATLTNGTLALLYLWQNLYSHMSYTSFTPIRVAWLSKAPDCHPHYSRSRTLTHVTGLALPYMWYDLCSHMCDMTLVRAQ